MRLQNAFGLALFLLFHVVEPTLCRPMQRFFAAAKQKSLCFDTKVFLMLIQSCVTRDTVQQQLLGKSTGSAEEQAMDEILSKAAALPGSPL